MQFFPAALQNLADQFAKLPGIGGKTAQRLAFHVLSLPMEDAEEFSNAILEAKTGAYLPRLPESDRPGGMPHLR